MNLTQAIQECARKLLQAHKADRTTSAFFLQAASVRDALFAYGATLGVTAGTIKAAFAAACNGASASKILKILQKGENLSVVLA